MNCWQRSASMNWKKWQTQSETISSWWFQPIWKTSVKLEIFPKRVKIKNIWNSHLDIFIKNCFYNDAKRLWRLLRTWNAHQKNPHQTMHWQGSIKLPSGKRSHSWLEYPPFSTGNSSSIIFQWSGFSSSMLVYRSVIVDLFRSILEHMSHKQKTSYFPSVFLVGE